MLKSQLIKSRFRLNQNPNSKEKVSFQSHYAIVHMTCSKPSYIPIDLKIETPLQNKIITSTKTVTHITKKHYSIGGTKV
jgi:hypothetical protein